MDVLWITEVSELRRQRDDSFHYQQARELKRYLLTRDEDFWDDQRHPLMSSPGVIVLSSEGADIAKLLVIALRALLQDFNLSPEPILLDQIKVRLTGEGFVIKMVDHDTQQKTVDSWSWKDVI